MRHESAPTINTEMTIRRMDLGDSDREAIAELAALDSREPLEAPVLGIEVEGNLLAAVSLATGEMISDPFSHTAELRTLLDLRARQLQRRGSKRALRLPHRSRPALGGAPAGTIISLPRWG
ncbi:MAG: hypothetical protein ACRDLO_01155 [Solirubrobacterales bacterium]